MSFDNCVYANFNFEFNKVIKRVNEKTEILDNIIINQNNEVLSIIKNILNNLRFHINGKKIIFI